VQDEVEFRGCVPTHFMRSSERKETAFTTSIWSPAIFGMKASSVPRKAE
jgi:hypothetical protein